MLPSGALRGALQAGIAICPDCVVAECWVQSNTGWDQLVAFFTPSPLVASHVDGSGKQVQRIIDLNTAQKFATQHQLSIRLATRVSTSGSPEWCHDMSGDELLQRLTFGVESAIAVPVIIQGVDIADAPACPAVLIFYSSKREQASLGISNALLAIAKSVAACVQLRACEMRGEDGRSLIRAQEQGFKERVSELQPTMDVAAGGDNDSAEVAEPSSARVLESDARPAEVWQNAVLGAAKLAAATMRASSAEVWVQLPTITAAGFGAANVQSNTFSLLADLEPYPLTVSGCPHDAAAAAPGERGQGSGLGGTDLQGMEEESESHVDAAIAFSPTARAGGVASVLVGSGQRLGQRSWQRSGTALHAAGSKEAPSPTTLRKISGLSMSLCSEAVVSAHQQPVVWLGPYELAARGGRDAGRAARAGAPHAQAAAAVPLRAIVGSAREDGGASLTQPSSLSPPSRTLPPPVTIVFVLYWAEPHEACCSPQGTQFLAAAAQTARIACATSKPPTTSVYGSGQQSVASSSRHGSAVATDGLEAGGGVGWHKEKVSAVSVSDLSVIIDGAPSSSARHSQGAQNRALSRAQSQSHPHGSMAGIGGGKRNGDIGVAMVRPSSGLDLLASLGMGGGGDEGASGPISSGASLGPSHSVGSGGSGTGTGTGGSGVDQEHSTRDSQALSEEASKGAPPGGPGQGIFGLMRASAIDMQALAEGGASKEQRSGGPSSWRKRAREADGEEGEEERTRARGGPVGLHLNNNSVLGLSGLPNDGGAGMGMYHDAPGFERLRGQQHVGEEEGGEDDGQGEGHDGEGEEEEEEGGGGSADEEVEEAGGEGAVKPSARGKRGRRHRGRAKRIAAPYSLHASEHLHMTVSGLPAVSAAALARVKGRSRAPKPKMAVALRRGKWPLEEEELTASIVEAFKAGLLPLANGTTLRTYLSGQLHCAPMRITKKFAKDASIGKQVYSKAGMDEGSWQRESDAVCGRIRVLRSRFFSAVMAKNRIDLNMVVPDPFPEGGVVVDTISAYYDDSGEPIPGLTEEQDHEHEQGGNDHAYGMGPGGEGEADGQMEDNGHGQGGSGGGVGHPDHATAGNAFGSHAVTGSGGQQAKAAQASHPAVKRPRRVSTAPAQTHAQGHAEGGVGRDILAPALPLPPAYSGGLFDIASQGQGRAPAGHGMGAGAGYASGSGGRGGQQVPSHSWAVGGTGGGQGHQPFLFGHNHSFSGGYPLSSTQAQMSNVAAPSGVVWGNPQMALSNSFGMIMGMGHPARVGGGAGQYSGQGMGYPSYPDLTKWTGANGGGGNGAVGLPMSPTAADRQAGGGRDGGGSGGGNVSLGLTLHPSASMTSLMNFETERLTPVAQGQGQGEHVSLRHGAMSMPTPLPESDSLLDMANASMAMNTGPSLRAPADGGRRKSAR